MGFLSSPQDGYGKPQNTVLFSSGKGAQEAWGSQEKCWPQSSYCLERNSSRHNGKPPHSAESIRSPGRKPWQGAAGGTKMIVTIMANTDTALTVQALF